MFGELRRRLAEATQREEVLTRKLDQAEGIRWELEEALRVCEGRQEHCGTTQGEHPPGAPWLWPWLGHAAVHSSVPRQPLAFNWHLGTPGTPTVPPRPAAASRITWEGLGSCRGPDQATQAQDRIGHPGLQFYSASASSVLFSKPQFALL